MSKPVRRLSAALATAAIAGAALLAPTAAYAADLDCASGQLAAPKQTQAPVYDEGGTTQIGQLDSMTCAVDGKLIANPLLAAAPGTYLVDFEGGIGRVEETYLSVFPSVPLDSLDRLVVVKTDEKMSAGIWSALGDSADERYGIPAASGPFASAPIDSPEPGTVFRSSELRATGQSNLAGVVAWAPVALATDRQVSWMVAEYLTEMPDSSWPTAVFEVPSEGYILYSDPLERQTIRAVDKGESLRVSEEVSGWSITSDGEWLRAPAEGEEKEASETWQALKDKAASAWDSGKEKAKELTETAKDTVAEKRANSKALTTPAMISSMVFAGLALITGVVGFVVRRARGFEAITPAGVAKSLTSALAAPASVVLSIVAVSMAPSAWVWPPFVAGAVALVSVFSLATLTSRMRGGQPHSTRDELIEGFRSPLAIIVGIGAGALSFGAAAFAHASWPGYLVAALATIAAYAGCAVTGRAESEAPETATDTDPVPAIDTPDSESVEVPAEAEPVETE